MGVRAVIRKHILEPILGSMNSFLKLDRAVADKKKWQNEAQKGEFEFHKKNEWRNSDRFMADTSLLFESFGFKKDQYRDKMVLDVGAGSKMRGKYFDGAKLVALEPMADDCMREIPWCDLKDAHAVYSKPAEELIPELVEQVDFVFSVNVLDHCYDFKKILANIHQYMKPGALAFISFDAHFVTDEMHPLILTEKNATQMMLEVGFKVEKQNQGFFGVYKADKKTDTYGHGSYCLNYWLRK